MNERLSIYKQMNNIDDEQSLNEQHDVGISRDIKNFHKSSSTLHETKSRITVDAEGLQRNLPIVVNKIINELPNEIISHKLRGSIRKEQHPVRYTFDGHLHIILGKNVKARHPSDDTTGPDVRLHLYSLPTNCDITEELLEERYRDDIIGQISLYIIPSDESASYEALYKAKEKEFLNAIKPLESKYGVTLIPYFYPRVEEFSRQGGSLTPTVTITSVSGKLGQLKKQNDGYYHYEINGVSYSSYLNYKDHRVFMNYTKLDNIDINGIAQEISKHIEELIRSIDELDSLIKNEPVAEKQLHAYILQLQSKYKDAKIFIHRAEDSHMSPFIVTYECDKNKWELNIPLGDVVNSFDKVKKHIQRKIYRTGNSFKPSYASDSVVLNFDTE